MNTFLVCLITVLAMLPYCSIFEWTLHRFFMHRNFLGIFKYPYERHTVVHHHVFKADETYHLQKESDKETIPMAWWNCFVLAAVGTVIPLKVGLALGYPIAIPATAVCVIFAYYGVYESIHWCMHLPRPERKRLMERCVPFRWLNGHHILHHRYMGKNFNVVLPLADLCFGTLILRAKKVFAQPKPNELIPSVQPKGVATENSSKGPRFGLA